MSEHSQVFTDVLQQVRQATMLTDEALTFAWRSMLDLLEQGQQGVLVECGTWFGGCSFGLALVQKQVFGRVIRPIYMLDSFEGLPPATERDGPAALEYQRRTADPGYFDNCRAPLREVERIRDSLGLSQDECRLVPGWFDTTAPILADTLVNTRIALLRIDCDWYAPVRLVLEQLEPLVDGNYSPPQNSA